MDTTRKTSEQQDAPRLTRLGSSAMNDGPNVATSNPTAPPGIQTEKCLAVDVQSFRNTELGRQLRQFSLGTSLKAIDGSPLMKKPNVEFPVTSKPSPNENSKDDSKKVNHSIRWAITLPQRPKNPLKPGKELNPETPAFIPGVNAVQTASKKKGKEKEAERTSDTAAEHTAMTRQGLWDNIYPSPYPPPLEPLPPVPATKPAGKEQENDEIRYDSDIPESFPINIPVLGGENFDDDRPADTPPQAPEAGSDVGPEQPEGSSAPQNQLESVTVQEAEEMEMSVGEVLHLMTTTELAKEELRDIIMDEPTARGRPWVDTDFEDEADEDMSGNFCGGYDQSTLESLEEGLAAEAATAAAAAEKPIEQLIDKVEGYVHSIGSGAPQATPKVPSSPAPANITVSPATPSSAPPAPLRCSAYPGPAALLPEDHFPPSGVPLRDRNGIPWTVNFIIPPKTQHVPDREEITDFDSVSRETLRLALVHGCRQAGSDEDTQEWRDMLLAFDVACRRTSGPVHFTWSSERKTAFYAGDEGVLEDPEDGDEEEEKGEVPVVKMDKGKGKAPMIEVVGRSSNDHSLPSEETQRPTKDAPGASPAPIAGRSSRSADASQSTDPKLAETSIPGTSYGQPTANARTPSKGIPHSGNYIDTVESNILAGAYASGIEGVNATPFSPLHEPPRPVKPDWGKLMDDLARQQAEEDVDSDPETQVSCSWSNASRQPSSHSSVSKNSKASSFSKGKDKAGSEDVSPTSPTAGPSTAVANTDYDDCASTTSDTPSQYEDARSAFPDSDSDSRPPTPETAPAIHYPHSPVFNALTDHHPPNPRYDARQIKSNTSLPCPGSTFYTFLVPCVRGEPNFRRPCPHPLTSHTSDNKSCKQHTTLHTHFRLPRWTSESHLDFPPLFKPQGERVYCTFRGLPARFGVPPRQTTTEIVVDNVVRAGMVGGEMLGRLAMRGVGRLDWALAREEDWEGTVGVEGTEEEDEELVVVGARRNGIGGVRVQDGAAGQVRDVGWRMVREGWRRGPWGPG